MPRWRVPPAKSYSSPTCANNCIPGSLANLVACFADPEVGVASGELVIRDGAGLEEASVGLLLEIREVDPSAAEPRWILCRAPPAASMPCAASWRHRFPRSP